MPIHCDTPRDNVRSTLLYVLEKHVVRQLSNQARQFLAVRILCNHRLKHALVTNGNTDQLLWLVLGSRLRQQFPGCCAAMVLNHQLLNLPYQVLKTPDDFTAAEFLEQFHFWKQHFWSILSVMRTVDGQPFVLDSQPQLLKFGRKGHRTTVSAHSAFMVLLRHLAFPSLLCDLQLILG